MVSQVFELHEYFKPYQQPPAAVFCSLAMKKQITATVSVTVLCFFIYKGNSFSLLDAQSKKSGNISFLAAHFIYMPGQAKYFQVRAKLEPSLGSDLSLGNKTKAVQLKAHCKLNE